MQLSISLFNGLAAGMSVFLVAAGLTLVFGILKILNFAQGAFFMMGAYIAFMIGATNPESITTYIFASVGAGLIVAVLGVVTDVVVFRRIRSFEEAVGLIATFAVLMVCNGVTKLFWGVESRSAQPPGALAGALKLGPIVLPMYSLFIILAGVALYVVLDLLLRKMWVGKIIQAVADDPWMSEASGVNVPLVFLGSVVFAFFLAGLAGGLLLPNQALSPELGGAYLLQAFVAVVLGGLGSIRGAFWICIMLGLAESVSSLVIPNVTGVSVYVALILVLVLRPQGLFQLRKA